MKNILRVYQYLRPYKKQLILNILFSILFVFFSLFSMAMLLPFINLLFGVIDTTVAANETGLKADLMRQMNEFLLMLKNDYGIFNTLLMVSGIYVCFSLLSNVSRYFSMFFLAPVRNGVVKDIRNVLYHKVTILPLSFFSDRRKGDLLTRFSSDLGEIEWNILSNVQFIIKDSITVIVFLIALIFMSPQMVLFAVVAAPLTLFAIHKIGSSLKRNSEKGQKHLGYLLSFLEETLAGMRIIQAFNVQDKSRGRFEELNDKYTRTNIKVLRRREIASPVTETFGILILCAILLFGGYLVFEGKLQGAMLILFAGLFARIIAPAQALTNSYYGLQKGRASANRFFEVIDAEETILEKPNAIQKTIFENSVRYDNVSFFYQTENQKPVTVLKNINLQIERGKSIAIVGPSGAGKTTLVDLLPRFYDCTSGRILIDEVPITEININSLRSMLGIVSQDCILFNDTVLHNIAFGLTDIDEEKVIEAAKIAHAHEFISQMPEGYYTNIGDRGLNLSGGQRQRISIARAILRNPPILILDEATSALDTESERLVQDALIALMQNRTSIVIAHRLSTILHSDEIIVMERGEIIEKGTHSQLLEKAGLYKKLIEMQSFKD